MGGEEGYTWRAFWFPFQEHGGQRFKQEMKSKEDNINDLKNHIRKYTKSNKSSFFFVNSCHY